MSEQEVRQILQDAQLVQTFCNVCAILIERANTTYTIGWGTTPAAAWADAARFLRGAPQPSSGPVADPFTTVEDIVAGHSLSRMGSLFADVEVERSPLEEWTRVARALRVHGLEVGRVGQ